MRIESEEVIFTAAPRFDALPTNNIDILPVNATPSVKDIEIYKSPASGVSVTNFLYGKPGQDLFILGNGNLTLVHGTSIKTSTAANKVLAANKIYHLKLIDNVWYEVTT